VGEEDPGRFRHPFLGRMEQELTKDLGLFARLGSRDCRSVR
jgi:hypothetical protein